MDDRQIENLKSACIVIGDGLKMAAEAVATVAAALEAIAVAKAMDVDPGRVWENDKADSCAEPLRRIDELESVVDIDIISAFAALAEEPEDIPPPKKLPRPAKYIGPVNKTNHAAAKPPRRARSSCRVIKR